jgi:hypothetical protein
VRGHARLGHRRALWTRGSGAGAGGVIAGKWPKAVFEGPLRMPIEMPVKRRRSHVRIPEKLEVGLVPSSIGSRRLNGRCLWSIPRAPGDFGMMGTSPRPPRCASTMGPWPVSFRIDGPPMPWRRGPISRNRKPSQEDHRAPSGRAAGARAYGHAEGDEGTRSHPHEFVTSIYPGHVCPAWSRWTCGTPPPHPASG